MSYGTGQHSMHMQHAEIDRRQRLINQNLNENAINLYCNEIEIMNLFSGERRNIVGRNSDFLMPEYILIDLNNQPGDITPDYIIQNFNFIVIIGGQSKYYPLQIMEYLSPSNVISGNVLKIPLLKT